MVVIMKYTVIKQHFGDKQYWVGDVREIDNEHDADELLALRLIAPLGEQKADNPTAKNQKNKQN